MLSIRRANASFSALISMVVCAFRLFLLLVSKLDKVGVAKSLKFPSVTILPPGSYRLQRFVDLFLFTRTGNVSGDRTGWQNRVINAKLLSAVRDGEPLPDPCFHRLPWLDALRVRQQGRHLCAASRERLWIADLPEPP